MMLRFLFAFSFLWGSITDAHASSQTQYRGLGSDQIATAEGPQYRVVVKAADDHRVSDQTTLVLSAPALASLTTVPPLFAIQRGLLPHLASSARHLHTRHRPARGPPVCPVV
jgi:hypothetical protein